MTQNKNFTVKSEVFIYKSYIIFDYLFIISYILAFKSSKLVVKLLNFFSIKSLP